MSPTVDIGRIRRVIPLIAAIALSVAPIAASAQSPFLSVTVRGMGVTDYSYRSRTSQKLVSATAIDVCQAEQPACKGLPFRSCTVNTINDVPFRGASHLRTVDSAARNTAITLQLTCGGETVEIVLRPLE